MNDHDNQDLIEELSEMEGVSGDEIIYDETLDVWATIALLMWIAGIILIIMSFFSLLILKVSIYSLTKSMVFLIFGAGLSAASGGFNRFMDYLTWRK